MRKVHHLLRVSPWESCVVLGILVFHFSYSIHHQNDIFKQKLSQQPQNTSTVHCPKSNPNFRDITWNVVENMILHEIFRIVSRFSHYISCFSVENLFTLGQCTVSERGNPKGRKENFIWQIMLRKVFQNSERFLCEIV